MAMTTCPNCGKQLRPGARFCGSCGATLSPAAPGKSAGDAAQPPADTLPCPKCGKPVRRGARFCSHCGQTMEVEGASATGAGHPPLPAAQPPAAGLTAASADTLAGGGRRAAGPRPAAPAPAAARPQRKGLPILLLGVLALICAAAGAGGLLVARNQGWIGAPTAAPTIAAAVALPTETDPPPTPQATSTEIPTPAPSATPEPSPTQPVAAPTEPAPILALPSATAAISATLTGLPPTITTTQPISVSLGALEVVLEDSFDGSLSENWLAWGDPRPTIDSGPGYKWLSLKADDASDGGVTTRTGVLVTNAPGLEVEFDVALQERYPNASLYMDWDPQQTRRGPELKEPGVFRLRVSKDTVFLQAPITGQTCDAPVDGFQQHRYLVRVIEGFGVELYLDGGETPVCALEFIGLATVPGRISFSGRGWITHVRIAQPAVIP